MPVTAWPMCYECELQSSCPLVSTTHDLPPTYHFQPLSDHNFLNTPTPQCNFLKSSDFNTEEKVIFLCCLHQFSEVGAGGGSHHIFSNRVMINNKS